MRIRYWLTGATGAAALAATLAFAPLTSAQQPTTAPAATTMMRGAGHGRGGMGGTGTGACAGTNFVDANNDGVCDNRGTGMGQGAGFVDANGDGVCDNRGTGMGQGGTGTGTGQGGRGPQGRGHR